MTRILSFLLLSLFLASPTLAQNKKKKSTTPKKPVAAATTTISAQQYNAVISALGSVSSGHLYFSYWALNTLADNAPGNIYDPASVKNLINIYHNIIQKAMQSLLDVRNTSDNGTDRDFLTNMLYAYNDVDSGAKCLYRYYDTKDSAEMKMFRSIHAEAWKKISDVLHLVPPPAAEAPKEPAVIKERKD